MFIGVYLACCLLATGLILIHRSTTWQRRFVILEGLLMLFFLDLFISLSLWAGILAIGETSTYSLPGDYTALGPTGWLALVVGALGLLSPFVAARLATRMGAEGS